MALEAAVFSQDPLLSYFCSKDLYPLLAGSWSNNYDNFTNYSSLFSADDEKQAAVGLFDPDMIILPPAASATPTPPSIPSEAGEWDHHHNYLPNSSPETRIGSDGHLHQYHQLVGSAARGREVVVSRMDGTSAPSAAVAGGGGGGGRRKRRRGSMKNKEEVENQRMTHIAVERNRRKQMNDYLAAIKSMMPPPYVQRGDQASIIGGAINYVKELEQLLHSLESQKRINQQRQKPDNDYPTSAPPPIFADFFTFPQFSRAAGSAINHQGSSSGGDTSSTLINSSILMDENNKRAITVEDTNSSNKKNNDNNNNNGTSSSCGAEIEVTMVDTHANVKILVKRQPKQLLKLVTSFQNVRLSVLHLNLTTTTTSTVDNMVLYTFSLKVEEGSQFNSVEEIAAAANHILEKIQRDSNPAVSFLI